MIKLARFSLPLVVCAVWATLMTSLPATPAVAQGTYQPTYVRRQGPQFDGWLSAVNKQLSARLLADHAWLWRHAIELREWAPDPASKKLEVWLARPSSMAARVLRTRYGPDILLSRRIMPPGQFLTGRGSDTPNFFAGDKILAVQGTTISECTSGPMVITNGTTSPDYMLTAGHCVFGSLGVEVDTNGFKMGDSVHVRLCNNCLDSAVINGNDYAQLVWGGAAVDENPPPSPPTYVEDGTAFPKAPSDLVTNDGAFTGEKRGLPVDNNNVTFCQSTNLCVIDLTEFGDGSSENCEHGDSGGPVIVHEDSTDMVHIAGTVDIGQFSVRGTDGFSVCYYEQIGDLLSRWNSYVPTALAGGGVRGTVWEAT